MALVWNEGFEGPGRTNTWTGGVTGTTFSDTVAPSLAGSPSDWLTTAASFNFTSTTVCTLSHTFAAPMNISWSSFDFVPGGGLTEGQFHYVALAPTSGAATVAWVHAYIVSGGVGLFLSYSFATGTQTLVAATPSPAGQRRRVESRWDQTNNVHQYFIDGVQVSNSVMSVTTSPLTGIAFGNVVGTGTTGTTFYIDNVRFDDAVRTGQPLSQLAQRRLGTNGLQYHQGYHSGQVGVHRF